MIDLINRTLYLFFVVLEFILMTDLLMSWLPIGTKIKEFMHHLTAPLLDPIRYLLKHSVFYSQVADLSPLIGFMFVSYMQQVFFVMLQ